MLKATAAFPNAEITEAKLKKWFEHCRFHLGEVKQDIYRVVYEHFSPDRVAITPAQSAYRALLHALDMRRPSRLVIATTNYDLVADTALEDIGWHTDNGTPQRPGLPVDIEGLVEGGLRSVPILHLHGCLGWYRRPGEDRAYATNNTTRYDPALGDPVVVLPDPNKSYGDPLLRTLWDQFGEALKAARRVLIIGHSLNDERLLQEIRSNVESLEWVGVTVPDLLDAPQVSATIREKLPGAHDIRMMFAAPFSKDSEAALTGGRSRREWHRSARHCRILGVACRNPALGLCFAVIDGPHAWSPFW